MASRSTPPLRSTTTRTEVARRSTSTRSRPRGATADASRSESSSSTESSTSLVLPRLGTSTSVRPMKAEAWAAAHASTHLHPPDRSAQQVYQSPSSGLRAPRGCGPAPTRCTEARSRPGSVARSAPDSGVADPDPGPPPGPAETTGRRDHRPPRPHHAEVPRAEPGPSEATTGPTPVRPAPVGPAHVGPAPRVIEGAGARRAGRSILGDMARKSVLASQAEDFPQWY